MAIKPYVRPVLTVKSLVVINILVRNEKTLVLSVDRDNDFGVKAGVVTPVIGIDHCMKAATALAVADPEDSDVNGLFAAIRMYKDLKADGRNVEIALICGDKNVGHKSDSIIIDQLEEVLEKVVPQRVMLVGDGAEDEFINPIVSSRVPIDSVKKVYVKQAPGLESALYILTRMINDPDKKKRFMVPLGAILALIGLIFIIEGIVLYYVTNNGDYILEVYRASFDLDEKLEVSLQKTKDLFCK
jgi:putative membrane protein